MSISVSSLFSEASSFTSFSGTIEDKTSTVPVIKETEDEHIEDDFDPIQVELKVQRKRIIHVLIDTVDEIYLALTLKELLTNNELHCLCKYISNDDLKAILDNFNMIENRIEKELLAMKNGENLEPYYNPDLHEIIYSLLKNENIKYLCRNLLENDLKQFPKFVINHFKALNEHIIAKLNTTAIQETKRQQYLCDVYHKNKLAKKRIKELQNKLQIRREKYSTSIDSKQKYINLHQQKIAEMYNDCRKLIDKTKTENERQMANDWQISNCKQIELKEQAKKTQTDYKTLLAKHLNGENISRKRRLKVETQLLYWIKKYDADMNERQDIYDNELHNYENEQDDFNSLVEKSEKQKIEYDVLMKEKADYEHQVWTEKVRFFILNNAARRVQRWYRKIMTAYKARKKALMKSLKRKKKK